MVITVNKTTEARLAALLVYPDKIWALSLASQAHAQMQIPVCIVLLMIPSPLESENLSLLAHLLTGFSSGLPLGTSTTLRSGSTCTLALVTN